MDLKNIDKSKAVRMSIFCVVCVIILVVVFQAGVFVGFKKASFLYHSGDNYYRAFGKHPQSMMDGDDLPASYGAAGKIVKVNLPEIIIADRGNMEKTIILRDNTMIMQFREAASPSDIKQDDFAVVIGSPNSKSQIEAKLIRLFPPPPSAASLKQ